MKFVFRRNAQHIRKEKIKNTDKTALGPIRGAVTGLPTWFLNFRFGAVFKSRSYQNRGIAAQHFSVEIPDSGLSTDFPEILSFCYLR